MYHRFAAIVVCSSVPVAGLAAPVSVVVRGPDGKPLGGAVVTVEAPGVSAPAPSRAYAVEQRDIAFQPRVLIVPVGAAVTFPNRDRIRHHVYSFSKPKRFELKLYGREEQRSVVFDRPGVVSLGCNIHDSMSGFLYVTATPFVAQTGADGRAALNGVPAGRATIRVWHPSIRVAGNSLSQSVAVPAAGLSTTLAVRR